MHTYQLYTLDVWGNETDGFMKHIEDIQGLEEYLKDLGILKQNDELTRGN
jgi:hypothetical protein